MTFSSSPTVSLLAIDLDMKTYAGSSYYASTISNTYYMTSPGFMKANICVNQQVAVCAPPPTHLLA